MWWLSVVLLAIPCLSGPIWPEALPGEEVGRFVDRLLDGARGKLRFTTEIPSLELRKAGLRLQSESAFIRGPTTLRRNGPATGAQYPSGSAGLSATVSFGIIEAEYPKVKVSLLGWHWSGHVTAVLREPEARLVIRVKRNVLSKCEVDAELDYPSAHISFEGLSLLPRILINILPQALLNNSVFRDFLFPLFGSELTTNIREAATRVLCNSTLLNLPHQLESMVVL